MTDDVASDYLKRPIEINAYVTCVSVCLCVCVCVCVWLCEICKLVWYKALKRHGLGSWLWNVIMHTVCFYDSSMSSGWVCGWAHTKVESNVRSDVCEWKRTYLYTCTYLLCDNCVGKVNVNFNRGCKPSKESWLPCQTRFSIHSQHVLKK